jgi:hypothetical protein
MIEPKKNSLLADYRLLLVGLLIVVAFGLGFYQRYFSSSSSVRPEQVVLARLHAKLPLSLFPAKVERIRDVELYKKINPRLSSAVQTGDWMVVYDDGVLIYRESTDQIIQTLTK